MATIMFFAPDLAEIAQLRRIRSFKRAGHDVSSISMQKQMIKVEWENLNLGAITNENLGRRLWLAILGLFKIWANRHYLQSFDLIIARNADMSLLALIARWMSGTKVPVIYECLDIHSLFTGSGMKSRIARKIEQFILQRITLLMVSSPGFIKNYFSPIQKYTGRWILVENKLWFPHQPIPRPHPEMKRSGPLTLGWVGAIRCQPSLDLLCTVAEQMGDKLWIEIRGVIHHHALKDFDARIKRHSNIHYGGPYSYPDGLGDVYNNCDLVWGQDLWQSGANSDWLLPNRIYEASWFGCPTIAVAATQTGSKIISDGLGFVIETASPSSLLLLLQRMSRADILKVKEHMAAREDSEMIITDNAVNQIVYEVLRNEDRNPA